jgi:3D (Asp-Asp-Asp) domain-containing protein
MKKLKSILRHISHQRMHIVVLAFLTWSMTLSWVDGVNRVPVIYAKESVSVVAPIDPYETTQSFPVVITAYSSTVDQTDSTPCITANGFDLCEHNRENVIATNILPFGTKVRFPEIYGKKIFTVQDRMNKRYTYRADIWKKDRQSAVRFGAKYTTIEVVEKKEENILALSQ